MATLGTQGSVATNPRAGLMGNMKNKGLAGSINQPTYASNDSIPFNAGSQGLSGLVSNNSAPKPSQPVSTQGVSSSQPVPGMLPKHPVSSITTSADGSTKHTFDTKSEGNTSAPASTTTPSTTPASTPTPNPALAGTTGTERANAVIGAAQDNPEIKYYRDMALQANEAQNVGRLAPYAESQFYGQGGQSEGALPDLTLPDLAGRGSANQGLFGALGNIYGSTAQTGLTNALNERQARIGAAGTVLGAGSPTGNIINVDPFTGKPVNSDINGLSDLAKQAGTIQGTQNAASGLASDYTTGKQLLTAADGIQQQIIDTLTKNPNLNVDPVTLLNNLNQYLGAQFSGTPQQLLAQQVQSYLAQLSKVGVDESTITNIAHQSSGSMATLLDSLRKTAQTLNESKNISGGTSGGSTGGGFAESW